MSLIHLDNLVIQVTRKPIRTLRMRVCPPDAEVRVSAPLHVSESDVIGFVSTREAWIRHHRGRILARRTVCPPPCAFVTGDTVLLWGQEHTLTVRAAPSRRLAGMRAEPGIIYLDVPPGADTAQRARIWDQSCRNLLMERLIALAVVWAPAMNVPCPELRLRQMKTRWGTCNPSIRRVWINTELVRRSPECLEYVVVHELAHLLERGHTERFRAILDRYLPAWRHIRQTLNTA